MEDFIDVSVGTSEKINPLFLIEEKVDYLIIGDIVSDVSHKLEIYNWLLEFWKISQENNFNIKKISGFYISLYNIHIEPLWIELLQENVNPEINHTPILHVKLNGVDLMKCNEAFELVKEYSNDFIKVLLNEEE